jgi:hypothetical protein
MIFQSIMTFSQSLQNIDGTYCDSDDTICFFADSVTFSIMCNGGLISPMIGNGKFNISEKILTIQTDDNIREEPRTNEPKQIGDTRIIKNETLVFLINSFDNMTLNLTLIGLIDNSSYKGQKTINKFMREHKKFKFRERILRKTNANTVQN